MSTLFLCIRSKILNNRPIPKNQKHHWIYFQKGTSIFSYIFRCFQRFWYSLPWRLSTNIISWFSKVTPTRESFFIRFQKVYEFRNSNLSSNISQVSILGPIFNLLFTNDLSSSCHKLLYADDTELFTQVNTAEESIIIIHKKIRN